jgi:hypothetical protein
VKPHAHGIIDDLNAVLGHPLYPLGDAVQRLQEERSLLMEEWNELAVLTRSIIRHRSSRFHGDELRWLMEKTGAFRNDLREHAAWTEEQLRPMLERVLDDAAGRLDDLHAAIRRLENRLDDFCGGLAAAASDPDRGREIPDLLLQAARACDGLFRLEERLLDELWERTGSDGAG